MSFGQNRAGLRRSRAENCGVKLSPYGEWKYLDALQGTSAVRAPRDRAHLPGMRAPRIRPGRCATI